MQLLVKGTRRILTTEKEVDTISEQITAKHDEVKQAVDKYTTAIDTVQSNINRMKQKQQTATQKALMKLLPGFLLFLWFSSVWLSVVFVSCD